MENETKDLGAVSESRVADVRTENPKMRATVGTVQAIDRDQLGHALEEHGKGKGKWADSIPITKEDLKKISNNLLSYDEIRQSTGTNGRRKQEAVFFRKKYDDVTICCVEINWFNRKIAYGIKVPGKVETQSRRKKENTESLTRVLPTESTTPFTPEAMGNTIRCSLR